MTSKHKTCRGVLKNRYLRMCLNLNDYQFKIGRYRLTYMNSTVITHQNPQLYTQKSQRERNTSMQIKKIIKPQGKKLKENYKNNQKTSNRMALSTFLSIITSNVNIQNVLIKRHTVGKKKAQSGRLSRKKIPCI